jgi:uroporphyrinogen decarboxylase
VGSRFGKRLHGVTMTDDWGTQRAAFVSTALWMDFFLPRYKRLFDRMHSYGWDVWVHSCGKVNEIVEGFIQAGANAVNLQQPRALGIEEMGKRYRGRVTFESLADIQASIPTGDPAKIDADALALEKHWMLPTGGFVFSDYGDSAALGLKDDTIKRHMYRRFSEVSQRLYGSPLPPIAD